MGKRRCKGHQSSKSRGGLHTALSVWQDRTGQAADRRMGCESESDDESGLYVGGNFKTEGGK